jgi:integrase
MKGSIVKKDNGRYYVVTHYQDPATGKWRQRAHGGHATKRAAERALRDVLGAMDKGEYVAPSKRSVASYLVDEWLPAKQTGVRASTLHSYSRLVDLHVVPRIGPVALQQLTAPMLNAYYADLIEGGRSDGTSGLSPTTVLYIHRVLRMAMSDAAAWGYVTRNVVDQARPPRKASQAERTMSTWEPAQVRRFLEYVADDWLYTVYDLAATTGMRRGEVLGLRWQDVDLDAGRLQVTQQLTTTDYRLSFGPPKTDRGRRTVPLSASTVAALRVQRRRQTEARLQVGPAWVDTGLLHTKADGGPVHPDYVAGAWRRHLKATGLPVIRFHDLRHTFATNALRAGVPAKVVSDILGHATVAFTLDTYTHAVPSMQTDAIDLVADLVWGAER